MQPSFFAITAAILLLASNAGTCAATGAASTVDLTGWRAYRNDQYSVELRYPPDYAAVTPRDQLQPAPLFRVWFKEASLVNSPIADREPPQFAVDVYDNASRQTLDAWLAGSGVTRTITGRTPGKWAHARSKLWREARTESANR